MSNKNFVEMLMADCIKSENFNSNNAWGFGGAYGGRFWFPNEIIVTVATACFRHTGTTDFVKVVQEDKIIIDLHNTADARKRIITYLQEMKCLS